MTKKLKLDAHGNPVPDGLGVSGERLWLSVEDVFDLDVHGGLLLMRACRCADILGRLAVEAQDNPGHRDQRERRPGAAPGVDGVPAGDRPVPADRVAADAQW
jgi:hypothetical protein